MPSTLPFKVTGTKAAGNTPQVGAGGSAVKWVKSRASQTPDIISPLGINPVMLGNAAVAPGPGSARGVRMVATRDGTISGVALYIAAAAGNIDVAILDTTATTRNVLWKSGSFTCPAASASSWNDLALNPGVVVTAGQQFDVAVTNNNAGFQIVRFAIANAQGARLPDGWMTAGVTSGSPAQFLGWTAAVTVGNWGTTLAEASMSGAAITALVVKLT